MHASRLHLITRLMRRVYGPATLLMAALLCPMTASADRILNDPALQAGLERWQSDRIADAALIWSGTVNPDNPAAASTHAALAQVLATIAWERVGDVRAYTSWANAISGYLQAGTSWELERSTLTAQLQRNRAALLLVSPDAAPILTPEDRWLESVQTLTGLLDYNGPQVGLSGSTAQTNSNVSINYFGTTPRSRGITETRQSSDVQSADIQSGDRGTPTDSTTQPTGDRRRMQQRANTALAEDSARSATANAPSVAISRLPSGPMAMVPSQIDLSENSLDKSSLDKSNSGESDPTDNSANQNQPNENSPNDQRATQPESQPTQLDPTNRTALSVAQALQTVTPLPVEPMIAPTAITATTRPITVTIAPRKINKASDHAALRARSVPVLPKVQPATMGYTALTGIETLDTRAIVLDEPLQQQLAQTAWRYFDSNRQPQTGLYNSKQGYAFATPWEIGHMLAGLVSAQQLGLIERDAFLNDMQMLLATLRDLPLYDQRLPNREYSTRTGQMIDMSNQISDVGSGWSAVGIGRLMLWLELTARYYPELEGAARDVSRGWSVADLVDQGQLRGMLRLQNEQPIDEGRLGYEQYAAAGLASQGVLLKNPFLYQTLATRQIDGVSVWVDSRPDSKTTSEPLYLGLMELGGIDGCFRQVADSQLKAQLAHAKRGRTLVAISEEFLPKAPWFVFNSVYAGQQDWKTSSRDGQSRPDLSSYSLKSVLAWHVIAPNGMNRWPSDLITRTSTPNGFRAGLFLDGSTNTAISLATNAIVLESLWYASRGQQPFMSFSESPAVGCPIGAPTLDDSTPDTP